MFWRVVFFSLLLFLALLLLLSLTLTLSIDPFPFACEHISAPKESKRFSHHSRALYFTMSNPLTAQILPGRLHSFAAYCIAVAGCYTMSMYYPNLQPSTWMSGWIVSANPVTCAQNVEFVDFIAPLLWYFHFARRLLEVLFVHEYRRKNTPVDMIFAGSSYVFYGWFSFSHFLFLLSLSCSTFFCVLILAPYILSSSRIIVAHTTRKDAWEIGPSEGIL